MTVNAVREQTLREIGCELRIAQHDRHDRMLARDHVEACCGHALAEVSGVLPQPRAQLIACLENVEDPHGSSSHEGRNTVRE